MKETDLIPSARDALVVGAEFPYYRIKQYANDEGFDLVDISYGNCIGQSFLLMVDESKDETITLALDGVVGVNYIYKVIYKA